MKNIIICLGLVFAIIALSIILITNPTFGTVSEDTKVFDPQKLRTHVEFLADSNPSRSARNGESLRRAQKYIEEEFERAGCEVELQTFDVDDEEHANVICSFGAQFSERLVAGAHYDVHFDENPGADDNASGIAAIIEIAHALNSDDSVLTKRVDLIAYTLEELPHFRTENMGSMIHARRAKEEGQDIELMISVEMIGYFSDEADSQRFPLPGMELFYGNTGNFIAVIGRLGEWGSVREVKKDMGAASIVVRSFNAPESLRTIGLSDHASYWKHGFPAVMVTDTSFLRNPHYHKSTDTPETLDYSKMSEVVSGLYNYILQ